MLPDDPVPLDAQTVSQLVRARPPHTDLAAFLRLVDQTAARVAESTDPVRALVGTALVAARRGPDALAEVDLALVQTAGRWSPHQLAAMIAALEPPATAPPVGWEQLRRRAQGLLEIAQWASDAAAPIAPGVAQLLRLAIDLRRPPTWSVDFHASVMKSPDRPKAAWWSVAVRYAPERAPAVAGLAADDLTAIQRVLDAADASPQPPDRKA